MTAEQAAKSRGAKTLQQVEDYFGLKESGQPLVSRQTLRNWHSNRHGKRKLFEAVVDAAVKSEQVNNN